MNTNSRIKSGIRHDENKFRIFDVPPKDRTLKALPAGIYELKCDDFGHYFEEISVKTDRLFELEIDKMGEVLAEVETFLGSTTKECYRAFGQKYRKGILMYGPPGTGKSSIVNLIVNRVIAERNAIVFYNPNPYDFSERMKEYEELDPGRLKVVILEDFEEKACSALLALLDGELSLEDIIFIATTNYIEHVRDNIKKRPSRFNLVLEVGSLSDLARKQFLEGFIPKELMGWYPLQDFVELSKGYTIDQLKHLVLTTFCNKMTPKEGVNRLARSGLVPEIKEVQKIEMGSEFSLLKDEPNVDIEN